jgi:Fur family peroxide stress response transcriptional regulator
VNPLEIQSPEAERRLRLALEVRGQRYTAQRAAVYRFLHATDVHPSAEDVFRRVRMELPGISLATVYKSLETLVDCGLVQKLTYGDTAARYDGRTDPHSHARCLGCGRIADVPGPMPGAEQLSLHDQAGHFRVTGYRLELTGFCADCDPGEGARA